MQKHPFLRLLAALLALFLPVAGFMAYTSYTIDPSGLFHGEQFARDAVELLLDGTPVAGYDQLATYTRKINESLIMASPAFDTVVIGSSRVMLINADMAGETGTFLNMGVVGGTCSDLFGSFYLCDRENKLPKTVILGIDAWSLNSSVADGRTVMDWYYAFLEKLGFETEYEAQAGRNRYLALLDPSYFQGALAYAKRDTTGEAKPQAVTENLYEQPTTVKLPDGTILYDCFFRRRSQTDTDIDAYDFARLQPNFYLNGWAGPTETEQAQFEAYVDYMLSKNIRVVLYLTPYHPLVYDTMKNDPRCTGAFAAEDYLRALAAEKGLTLLGSFDPEALGLKNTDFYDHFHLRDEAVNRVFAPLRNEG